MVDIIALKEYFKKLQKIINFSAEFNIGNRRLIKANKINDLMCCILATLPDSYKKILKTKTNVQRYNSVLSYSVLTKLLNKRFFLDKNMCLVNVDKVNRLIGSINATIERDIRSIEDIYNN